MGYAAYRFSCPDCARIGLLPELLVLGVIPAVYLVLMYMTQPEKDKAAAELGRPDGL